MKKIRARHYIMFFVLIAIALSAMLFFSGITSKIAGSSEEYVKRASEHINKGEIKSAVIELKNALQKDAKNLKARLLLGEVYLKAGDGVSAEKELLRAKKLGADEGELAVTLGKAYLFQGNHDEVLKSINDNESYSPSIRAEIISLQAQAHLRNNEKEKAQTLFEQALKLNTDSVSARLGQVRIAVLNKNNDAAEAQAKKVIERYADNDEAWLVYGEIAQLKNKPKDARQRYDKAHELNPYNLLALLGMASANIALDEFDDAIKATDLVLKVAAKHPVANYLRGVALFKKKDIDAADESLQKVLRAVPNHIPSLQLLGSIHYSKGKYEQAEKMLSQVIAVNPANINAVKILAATRLKTKQPKQAIEILKPFSGKHKDPQILAMLGTAYMQNRENDKGMEYLEKAMALSPEAAGIQTQLALAQLISGDSVKAVKQLESAVELSPELMQAEVMLVLVHMRNKDYDKALKSASTLQKKNTGDPVPLNLMGAAYLGLEKRELATRQFEKALTLDATFVPAAINLAKLDEQDNKTASAKTRYKNVIKHRPGHAGALMSLARITEKEGMQQEALQYVEKAYELNPDNVMPGLFLIRYHMNQKAVLKALATARALKDNHPENPLVLKSLGMVQTANKEYSNAIASFKSLQMLQPNSPEPAWLMGKAHFAADDLSAARKAFKQSLKLKDNYVSAQLALVDLEMKLDQPQKAISITKTLQKQYPKQALGYQVEGDIYLKTKSYNKAIEQYKKAMSKAKSSSLVFKLSSAYAGAGKIKENYSLLEGWLKDNSKDLSVMLLLANSYQNNGLPEKAVQLYLKIIQNSPPDVATLNNLAWSLHVLGRTDAVDYAMRAYDLAPANPAVIDTFGWLLVESGEINRGLELLQQAVIKAPNIADIRYHLGVGLHKAGRKAEAKSELTKVLEMAPKFTDAVAVRALLAELEK